MANPMLRGALLVCLALLAGCGKLPKIELPKIALESLPKVDGKYLLMQISNARLEVDPTTSDAITAVGRCADLVTHCGSDGRSLDDCVAAAPGCKPDRPWKEDDDCCPSACKDAYEERRDGGAEPIDAFEHVFFLDHSCFPGLAAALEGQS